MSSSLRKGRGTEADLIELRDLLPGWDFLVLFAPDGASGGIIFCIAPCLESI